MRISRTYGVQALAAVGLAGAALLTPAVASAATAAPQTPANCTITVSGQTVIALCTSGSGEYRIHLWCVKVDDPSQSYVVNGPWVTPPKKSEATCPAGTYPTQEAIQKR
jgi:hypothetical protein